jgi:predicted secreted hydrolase
MKKLVVIACLLAAFAGMAFADLPDDPITFPEDDYGHQDNPAYYPMGSYAEWWYFNGMVKGISLSTCSERNLAFYISFHNHKFIALPDDIRLVLSAVTDIDTGDYYFTPMTNSAEPFAVSTVSTDSMLVEYEGSLSGGKAKLEGIFTPPNNTDKTTMKINSELSTLDGKVIKLNLILQPINDALPVNGGKIDMPGSYYGIPNGESFYISKTKVLIGGKITMDNEVIFINSLESEAWHDHQFGDFLGSDSTGWEWFSVRLDTDGNGTPDLYGNIFGFVDIVTKDLISGYGSFILPDGTISHLTYDSTMTWEKSNFITTPLDYVFPLKHLIAFPELNLTMEIESMIEDQYSENMYEGICDVTATYNGGSFTGYAYKELTY